MSLGRVLVVDTIDNANIISKNINYSYKIVTLDGELLIKEEPFHLKVV